MIDELRAEHGVERICRSGGRPVYVLRGQGPGA